MICVYPSNGFRGGGSCRILESMCRCYYCGSNGTKLYSGLITNTVRYSHRLRMYTCKLCESAGYFRIATTTTVVKLMPRLQNSRSDAVLRISTVYALTLNCIETTQHIGGREIWAVLFHPYLKWQFIPREVLYQRQSHAPTRYNQGNILHCMNRATYIPDVDLSFMCRRVCDSMLCHNAFALKNHSFPQVPYTVMIRILDFTTPGW